MKNYNTPEYRKERRLVAWVDPILKRKVQHKATSSGRSVSAVLEEIIEVHFYGEVRADRNN